MESKDKTTSVSIGGECKKPSYSVFSAGDLLINGVKYFNPTIKKFCVKISTTGK